MFFGDQAMSFVQDGSGGGRPTAVTPPDFVDLFFPRGHLACTERAVFLAR